MRKVFVMAILLLGATSCEKIKNMANISINVPFSQTMSVPKFNVPITFPADGMYLSLPTQAVVIDTQKVLEEYRSHDEMVVEVKLKSFSQKIIGGDSKNFDFMDMVQVYASATGLPEKLVAYNNFVPKNADSIALDCVKEDIKPYLDRDTIYLRVYGHFNKLPESATYKLDFKFNMVTNVFEEEHN